MVFAATESGEVWCIGRRIGAQLQEAGLKTVLDVVRLDPAMVRGRWSVAGTARTVNIYKDVKFSDHASLTIDYDVCFCFCFCF